MKPWKLPHGWIWTTLGESFKWGSGGTPLKSNNSFYEGGDIPWVIIGDLNDGLVTNTQTQITQKGLDNSSAKWVEEGSVLIAMYGSIGKLGIAGKRLTTNQAIAFTNPNPINGKYLFYYLMGERNNLLNLGSGATQQNISQTVIKAYLFPLAPHPEQKRIVERIESLFTQLDAGVAGLKRAQAALKRYRASVLKAACEGRLVLQDPNDEPAEELLKRILAEKADKIPAPIGDLPELPKGWVWARVGWLTLNMQYGTSEKANLNAAGIPVLRMGNIQAGSLDYNNLKYLPINTKGLDKLVLEPGDLLFNRTNSAELVGKTAIYRENHPQATFASYLIRVQLHPNVLPDNVSFHINSIYGRQFIASVVSQQVGQANVNGTKLANMPIPLAPFAEQHRIVAEVERRLSVLNELEETISVSLKRAARLRQAILKRAFEGRLVE